MQMYFHSHFKFLDHTYLLIVYMCVFRHMHITCEHVKVRGQLVVISYHFLPCGSQESNFVFQAWWQAPLPTEPPHRPRPHSTPICLHLESAQRAHKA